MPDEDCEGFRDVKVKIRVEINYDLKINLPSAYAISTDSKNHIKEQLKVLEATISLVKSKN
eukprot:7962168-Ditylum_brightwellii.AAC.1